MESGNQNDIKSETVTLETVPESVEDVIKKADEIIQVESNNNEESDKENKQVVTQGEESEKEEVSTEKKEISNAILLKHLKKLYIEVLNVKRMVGENQPPNKVSMKHPPPPPPSPSASPKVKLRKKRTKKKLIQAEY